MPSLGQTYMCNSLEGREEGTGVIKFFFEEWQEAHSRSQGYYLRVGLPDRRANLRVGIGLHVFLCPVFHVRLCVGYSKDLKSLRNYKNLKNLKTFLRPRAYRFHQLWAQSW